MILADVRSTQCGEVNIAAIMGKACRAQFSTKTHLKKKKISKKKIIKGLRDVPTANTVNYDIDLSVNSLNDDTQSIADFSTA